MRIALYQGLSAISRAIRWQTRSPYSHAAFLLDDGTVIEAWQPCVRWVDNLSAQHTPGTVVDIFEFLCPLTREENDKLVYYARQDLGTPYDYRSIVRFMTRRRGDGSRRRLFCSEQVYSRCAQIGRELLARTEAWRVPPDWIARSPHLKLSETVTTTAFRMVSGGSQTVTLPNPEAAKEYAKTRLVPRLRSPHDLKTQFGQLANAAAILYANTDGLNLGGHLESARSFVKAELDRSAPYLS